jgi:hypothetical protein
VTVADLIAELQRYPGHLPVKVAISEVACPNESGDIRFHFLTRDDAIEAEAVVFEGTHVLLESK